MNHRSSVTLHCKQSSRRSFPRHQQSLVPTVIVVFIDILPNWGLFDIIKQICHASVGILMECLPSGKPSSLSETFHQDTHTGMAYLYIVTFKIFMMRLDIYIFFMIHYLGNNFNNTACLPGTLDEDVFGHLSWDLNLLILIALPPSKTLLRNITIFLHEKISKSVKS